MHLTYSRIVILVGILKTVMRNIKSFNTINILSLRFRVNFLLNFMMISNNFLRHIIVFCEFLLRLIGQRVVNIVTTLLVEIGIMTL